ncbi:uncharacterized protein C8R40DRAFT_919694 [Lentinula edodes]|uniref:uncharacterized protein n=1 Tax=Lentinula edodes TaxID=5353 RepID=UPI001E8CE217|nr:uncharacterized protein C8R40DRAFT_919694 [Lentinula edodes]KAH7867701.1 hypothetical protein C8R40DRAFT_919694 [Lentinula edodes]
MARVLQGATALLLQAPTKSLVLVTCLGIRRHFSILFLTIKLNTFSPQNRTFSYICISGRTHKTLSPPEPVISHELPGTS